MFIVWFIPNKKKNKKITKVLNIEKLNQIIITIQVIEEIPIKAKISRIKGYLIFKLLKEKSNNTKRKCLTNLYITKKKKKGN